MTMRLLFSIIALALAAALFALPEGAKAQACPPGQRIIGMTPAGNGVARAPICVRDGQQQQSQQPQQPSGPSGYWEKTWGALAPSPKGGVLGVATGASSKTEAERRALADCKAKGGPECKVEIAFHNQCGAMVVGQKKLYTARAGSPQDVKEYGIELCQKDGDTNCRLYHSACTEPVFHKY